MRRLLAKFFVPVMIFLFAGRVFAMTSENYSVSWDSINSGGEDTSSSTNYGLRDTIGEQATGVSSSTTYTVQAGYRVGDQDLPYIDFAIYNQNSSVQVTYTSFDSAGKSVVVSSASLFSVGNMIEVIESPGINQKIAIGKITSINGNRLYVDRWDGSTGTMNASPTGSNYVELLQSSSAIDFGSLQGAAFATSLTATRVSTSARSGYTVYMQADGGLRSSIHSFQSVLDGQVTPGVEEYGWRVSGSSAATTTAHDFPFTTDLVSIQQNSAPVTNEGLCFEYRLSTVSTVPSGSHSQTVTYTATANF